MDSTNLDALQRIALGDWKEETLGEAPPREPTAPWHKTRKHYVRIHQIEYWIRRLLKKRAKRTLVKYHGADSGELRYLSLPGDELLDVFVVADLCREMDRRLRCLGFNTPTDRTPIQARRQECEQIIRSHPCIEEISIELDQFERVGTNSSKAYRRLLDFGPCDVIYLDFCNRIFEPNDCTMSALRELLSFQCNKQTSDWLLFLTGRFSRAALDAAQLESYCHAVLQNMHVSDEFRMLAVDKFGFRMSDDEDGGVLPSDANFGYAACLAMCKHLLKFMEKNFLGRWNLSLKAAHTYSVDPDASQPDMFCLALWFSWIPTKAVDPREQAANSTKQLRADRVEGICEPNLAVDLANKLLQGQDVERLFRQEPAMYDTVRERNRELLRRVGYSEVAVERFLMEERDLVISG